MEITRDKLPESTKLILDSIDQADFIAVDCEFSGMRISKSKIPQSPDQRYTETKAAAECFAVIQMGLCPTRWNHELQQYEASPYNFFISPTLFSQFNENVLCRKIEFEAAAIEFLLQHNFDFSKLFRQGVFYLNEQEEGKLREDFLRKREIIQADRQGKEIYTWKHDTSEWKLPFVNVDTPNGFFRRLLCQELEINAEFTFETRPVTSKGNEAVENDRKLRMIGGFEGKIDKAKGIIATTICAHFRPQNYTRLSQQIEKASRWTVNCPLFPV
ncbi:Poly(A)-specific ribonuclease PARN [Neolecta irregularis DAH-3]|uniref:Poly(A)-specific ribonuclease PARN n=1 Tax=Neolecta irregularis (strain DAH-3) TaxID=1198029 RepID=A0A1U7LNH3_NEOID|nr:Poly(A)-specific ribonuclease PARN [Neolecta irregularis DAH-3]|eukprot:OLL24220.1 Poly(A)-specific ribonuclease PARN [Neolecta irregularis DAH-3]